MFVEIQRPADNFSDSFKAYFQKMDIIPSDDSLGALEFSTQDQGNGWSLTFYKAFEICVLNGGDSRMTSSSRRSFTLTIRSRDNNRPEDIDCGARRQLLPGDCATETLSVDEQAQYLN